MTSRIVWGRKAVPHHFSSYNHAQTFWDIYQKLLHKRIDFAYPPPHPPPYLPTHLKSCNRFNPHQNCPVGGREWGIQICWVREKSISSYYGRMYFTLFQWCALLLNSAKFCLQVSATNAKSTIVLHLHVMECKRCEDYNVFHQVH